MEIIDFIKKTINDYEQIKNIIDQKLIELRSLANNLGYKLQNTPTRTINEIESKRRQIMEKVEKVKASIPQKNCMPNFTNMGYKNE